MTKRFDTPASTDGAMFIVQAGMACKPFGFDMNDPAIRKAFEAKEPEGVSTGLYETVFADATDITPGPRLSRPPRPSGCWRARGCSTTPGNRSSTWVPASSACSHEHRHRVDTSGGVLRTALGTPIAVSAGYESKTGGKLDAEQWVFVTGAMVLARGAPILQAELDRTTNDQVVLYERLYVAGIDCLVGKVKVKVY